MEIILGKLHEIVEKEYYETGTSQPIFIFKDEAYYVIGMNHGLIVVEGPNMKLQFMDSKTIVEWGSK